MASHNELCNEVLASSLELRLLCIADIGSWACLPCRGTMYSEFVPRGQQPLHSPMASARPILTRQPDGSTPASTPSVSSASSGLGASAKPAISSVAATTQSSAPPVIREEEKRASHACGCWPFGRSKRQ